MLSWLTWWRRGPRRGGAPARAARAPAATPPAPLSLDPQALVALLELPLAPGPDPAIVADLEARIRGMIYDGRLGVPAFPSAAARVLELIERPAIDVNHLVGALHWEPALVAEIVVTANSAMYASAGRGQTLDDLRSAVMTLGLQQVGTIAAAVSARALFEPSSRAEFELYPALWTGAHRESLVVAFAAAWLAQARRVPRHDRVFLRAVITGVGRTLALRALARQLLTGRCPARPPLDAIQAAVDTMHREAAACAIAGWDLPPTVTRAVEPADGVEAAIVDLASTLVELRRAPLHTGAAARARALATTLGLDAGWLKVLVRECAEAQARVDALHEPAARA